MNNLKIPKDWKLVSVTPDTDNQDCLIIEMMDPKSGCTFTYITNATMEDANKWIEQTKERMLEENR